MKHRKETLEYNTDVFKHTDLDSNGYLEWEEYIGMVRDYTCRVFTDVIIIIKERFTYHNYIVHA